MMQLIPRFIRRAWRRFGLWVGFYTPHVYKPDDHLEDVINRIVCSSTVTGAFIVAVETKQAMIKLLSYMEKNAITAIAATNLDCGRLPQKDVPSVLRLMRATPDRYQVIVMNKNTAAVGWAVPQEFKDYWGHVFMLTTFTPRNQNWVNQYQARVRT